MSLREPVRGDTIRAYTQDIFAGVDARRGACDGAIRSAVNFCSEYQPNLCVRGKRFYRAYDFPILGLCSFDGKYGYILSGAEEEQHTENVTDAEDGSEKEVSTVVEKDVFYFDGKRIGALKQMYQGQVRSFARCGAYLCIFPDMMMFKDAFAGFSDKKRAALEAYSEDNAGGKKISMQSASNLKIVDEFVDANIKAAELVGLRLKFTHDYGTYESFYSTVLEAKAVVSALAYEADEVVFTLTLSNVGSRLNNDGEEISVDVGEYSFVIIPYLFQDMENEITTTVTFECDTHLEDETKQYDFIYLRESKRRNGGDSESTNFSFFHKDDYIEITGANLYENNGFFTIDEVDVSAKFSDNWEGQVLRFPAGTFEADKNAMGDVSNKLTIRRVVPKMKYYTGVNNRLFGCGKDGIFASALGAPERWYDYDGISTDSWGVSVTSGGEFTACCAYGDTLMFFKRDRLFKLYGATPSEYALYEIGCLGVLPGAAGTVCDVSGTLFWLSEKGVCAYTGSFPQVISEELGDIDLSGCTVGGSDGRKYYLSDGKRMYIYDTWRGSWSIEEGGAECFTYAGGLLFSADDKRIASLIERDGFELCEENVENVCEFAPMYFSSPDMKAISKLRFRCVSGEQAGDEKELRVYIAYDDRGEFELIGSFIPEHFMRTFLVPVKPKRCDSYVLRLESMGRYRLQSITTEFYIGSGAPGRS